MTATTALISFALIAWVLQIGLGWWQIMRFNRAFAIMEKGHYLGIGRSNNGRFKPRVLIALSFNEQQIVIDSILMQGLTVFALPKKMVLLHGIPLAQIDPIAIFPHHRSCQQALACALKAI